MGRPEQKDPTPARIRKLAADVRMVIIDWGKVSPSEIDEGALRDIERVRLDMDDAIDMLRRAEGAGSVDAAVETDRALRDIGENVGRCLRRLNQSGIHIGASVKVENWTDSDAETDEEFDVSACRLRLRVVDSSEALHGSPR
jgi:hypothetical protein